TRYGVDFPSSSRIRSTAPLSGKGSRAGLIWIVIRAGFGPAGRIIPSIVVCKTLRMPARHRGEIERLRRILGHTTYVMVMRYVHLDKGDLYRDFDLRSAF